jgi:hypothetical protein
MKFNNTLNCVWAGTLLVLLAFVAVSSTGCTVYTNGMTLPNPYYHKNNPQYFPRGTEFPFPNEAANLQEVERDRQQSQR